jgi:hypothetical protein
MLTSIFYLPIAKIPFGDTDSPDPYRPIEVLAILISNEDIRLVDIHAPELPIPVESRPGN